jgi:hypothetical protein
VKDIIPKGGSSYNGINEEINNGMTHGGQNIKMGGKAEKREKDNDSCC